LGEQLFDAANEPKEFITIPDGNHNMPQSDEFYEAMKRFLEDLP
jgi:fermentation-respiration switch protein FrsA (DUF1100 family)